MNWVDPAFSAASALALAGWLILLLGSRWPALQTNCAGGIIPSLLAVAYAAIFPALYVGAPGGYGSVDQLLTLLGSDRRIALAAWLHILAFDLLIGTWIVRDARERGIGALARVLALLLTFMFGPAGWLCYRVQRRMAGGPDQNPQQPTQER
jgi:hypothetical protein